MTQAPAATSQGNELLAQISIRYQTFPRTIAPPSFAEQVAGVFRKHESEISSTVLQEPLSSDQCLERLHDDLVGLGFQCESGKTASGKINRPITYGENGAPEVNYDIDAYHPDWEAALEVEAGRAWMGNAVYRDLIRASVMVQVRYLILAVPNEYKYKSSGRSTVSKDYTNTRDLADALYRHSSFQLPYGLVLIGY